MRRVFLAASGLKLDLLSRFCTLLFFKEENLSIPLAPLGGGDKHMRSQTFLYEIQFRTKSFFWCDEPQTESTFSFLYIIIYVTKNQ